MLLAAVNICETMLHESYVKELQKIPLLDDTA
jgi:hypothetical protein